MASTSAIRDTIRAMMGTQTTTVQGIRRASATQPNDALVLRYRGKDFDVRASIGGRRSRIIGRFS